MKFTKKRYTKRNYRKKQQYKLRRQLKRRSRHRSRHQSKYKTRRYLKQKGGSNDFIQLGYNTTRGMTSTIKNFLNTYVGNSHSPSPQATKSQYSKHL